MKYRPHRYLTSFPVQLRTHHGIQQANIVNVNKAGARIKGAVNLTQGDRIQFSILSRPVEGIVRWEKSGTIGIVFQPSLTDTQVATLTHQSAPNNAHRPGTVGFNFGKLR